MSVKTEVLLAKEVGGRHRSAPPPAVLPTAEAPASARAGLETRIYDADARFYRYGEIPATAPTVKTEKRRRGRGFFFTIGLLIVTGFGLLGGVAAGIYGLAEKMRPPVTVSRVDVRELPGDENGDRAADANRPDAAASEKAAVRSNNDKDLPVNPAEKEVPLAAEQTRKKSVEPVGGKIPAPERSPADPAQTTSRRTISDPAETTVSKKTTVSSTGVLPLDSRSDRYQPARPDRRRSESSNDSLEFQRFPKNERRPSAEKVKPLKPEQRSRLRNMLRKQRRMS
jgi:hypothetical protein